MHLRALRLRGTDKNYEIDFLRNESNLVVIAGPISTGKTTALEFVDYCLGDDDHPTHPEVSRKVRSASLEFDAQGETWTIERATFSDEAIAWVHRGGLNDTEAPRLRKVVDVPSVDDSLSAWLLEVVGLAGIKLKVSPNNPHSVIHDLSFRDLMWTCFLPNKRLDNEDLLFETNDYKRFKLQQVIELIFGVHDSVLADLMARAKALREERAQQRADLAALELFLKENEVPDKAAISTHRGELMERQEDLREQLKAIEGEMRDLTAFAAAQRRRFDEARTASRTASARLRDRTSLQARLLPLRGQYAEDERKLVFVGETKRLLNPFALTLCPNCLEELHETPTVEDGHCTMCHQALSLESELTFDLENERKALRERRSNLDRYIESVGEEILEAEAQLQQTRQREDEARDSLESRVASSLSPGIQARDSLMQQRADAESTVRDLDRALGWRESLDRRTVELADLEKKLEAVMKDLRDRQSNQADRTQLVDDLSLRFRQLLTDWSFPKLDDGGEPFLDERFVPWVRGRPYREIGSTGALTLISVAWTLAIFETAAERGAAHPGFLMIDTPSKSIGTHQAGSDDDDFRDDRIVEQMWAHLASWAEAHPDSQLVIVDNTPPAGAEPGVVVRYSGRRDDPPYGLIDDEA